VALAYNAGTNVIGLCAAGLSARHQLVLANFVPCAPTRGAGPQGMYVMGGCSTRRGKLGSRGTGCAAAT
jgi:hypothetical protein